MAVTTRGGVVTDLSRLDARVKALEEGLTNLGDEVATPGGGGGGGGTTTVELPWFDVTAFGAAGDGSTDDYGSINNALTAALLVSNVYNGAVIYFPHTALGYYLGTRLVIPQDSGNITFMGGGEYVEIICAGTGFLQSNGASGHNNFYIGFDNLMLSAATRRAASSVALDLHFTDVVRLNALRINGFEESLKLDTSTGVQLMICRFYDNKYGPHIGAGSGGFKMMGGTLDSNELGFLIDGVSNGVGFYGVECDTDISGLNGASSQGAGKITAAANATSFVNCSFFAEATPVSGTGATILLDGSSTNTSFTNCHFNGQLSGSASQAAVKIVASSNVSFFGGKTMAHSASSLICSTGASKVMLVNMSNTETTFCTGTASGVPVRLLAEDALLNVKNTLAVDHPGVIMARGDGSANGGVMQWNNSTNAIHQSIYYASGLVVGEASKNMGFYGVTPVAQPTGWGSPTGTATRTTFATTTVTLAQLAEHVKALIDDLKGEGLIAA